MGRHLERDPQPARAAEPSLDRQSQGSLQPHLYPELARAGPEQRLELRVALQLLAHSDHAGLGSPDPVVIDIEPVQFTLAR